MKNAVSGIVLILLFTSVLSSAFLIQPVESDYVWSETIYIRADGSVEPLGAPISTLDNVIYNFTDNIGGVVPGTGTALVIQRNSIILNGAGYALQDLGTGFQTKGIVMSGRTNVTIKSIRIKNFSAGIQILSNSKNNSVCENIITNCSWGGIYLGSSSGNFISGNNVTDNYTGIALGDSPNNSISGNTVENCSHYGIDLYLSSGCSISGNNITANGVRALRLASSSNCSVSGNIMAATSNGHGIEVTGSSNCSFSGNTIAANNYNGINLRSSSNYNNISGNTITVNNQHGIDLGGSSNYNSISQNTIAANNMNGIALLGSSNNSMSSNMITSNIGDGVSLYGARNSSLNGNTITNNNYGIRLESNSNYNSISGNNVTNSSSDGVSFWSSSYNSIWRNNVTNNGDGIWLAESSNYNSIWGNNIRANVGNGISLGGSSNNNISGNNLANNADKGIFLIGAFDNSIVRNSVVNNGFGLELNVAYNNTLYHNNFVGNTYQTYIYPGGDTNIWDDGYPSGGNYWSDYAGIDSYSGPYQNETGSDGIGDTPYIIYNDNGDDRYPFMSPYGEVPEDLTPPITLTDYDGLWHTTDFTITLTATDIGSGVAETYYRINDGPIRNLSTNGQPLISAEGANNKLEYWSLDNDDNEELPHKILTGIKLDKTASTGSVTIAAGAAYTNSTSITLTLSGNDATSGVAQMRFSNDNAAWSTWETYATSKTWVLTTGEGTKTVYVQFMDHAGLISPSYQDTITLDTTKPAANAGQDQTATVGTAVSFDAGASSDNVGIVSYKWSFGDGATSTGETATHTYTTVGTYTVTLTVKDAAGNAATHQITVTVESPIAEAFPATWIAAAAAAAIALLILAAVFLRRKRKKRCPNCGANMPADSKLCEKCRTPIQ